MTTEEIKLPPLEQALLDVLQALDNQIAREMQRTPASRESQGVQKWEPIATRVERLTAFILSSLGAQEVQLESLLVLCQASVKALRMGCEDLGKEGLGKMRSNYCAGTFEAVINDARTGTDLLNDTPHLS